MFWHAMPPELNTARLMAGSGPAPMLQAASGWEALGNALESQAQELASILVALKGAWSGAGSERAIATTTPVVAWLHTAAQQAQQLALRASAQAASYTKALATTPSLPEIGANHITHAVLTATNFLGVNLVPIGFNETDYFVRMWNQAGAAMDIYQAETLANTAFEPLSPMKPILAPEAGQTAAGEALGGRSGMASQAAPGAARTLAAIAEDPLTPTPTPGIGVPLESTTPYLGALQQVAQLSGPMQQLMQPLQQMTSLAGQNGGAGTIGDQLAGDQRGDGEVGQVGLLGASPLSNHPLVGGSGPSVGLGLMHSESLPGAGGAESRTALMSRLIDKSPQLAPTAGAGSSAAGGLAPVGMAGQGAQAGGGSKPGLAAPAFATHDQDTNDSDNPHDQDDW